MSDRETALDRRTLVATLAIALLLGVFAMNDAPIGIWKDDGQYLVLARALARGDGYRYMNLPGAPAATHFPPGFALLLAPLWWVAPRFPANVAFFKLVNVALLPLAALAVRAFARRIGGLSALAASSVAVASVATVPVLLYAGLLCSETAFIAALCAVLMAADRLVGRPDGATRRLSLGVGLAIGGLAMLRTLGGAVLPAVLAVLLWRRRWADAALALAGALVVLVPWQLWISAHAHEVPTAISGGYGSYGTWLVDAYRAGGAPLALEVVRHNLNGLLILLALFGLMHAAWWAKAAAVGALLVLAGAGVRRLWPRGPVSLLFFLPYGAAILVWPFAPERFLWPLWPIIIVALVVGAVDLGWGALVPRPGQLAARLAGAGLAALFVVWHVRTWPTLDFEGVERELAREGIAVARVAASLPSDGLVATDQDVIVHLYAGRPAVPLLALSAEQYVRQRSDAELAAQAGRVLAAYHPRWVVVAEIESRRAAQWLARRGRLRLSGAYASGVLVYDVLP